MLVLRERLRSSRVCAPQPMRGSRSPTDVLFSLIGDIFAADFGLARRRRTCGVPTAFLTCRSSLVHVGGASSPSAGLDDRFLLGKGRFFPYTGAMLLFGHHTCHSLHSDRADVDSWDSARRNRRILRSRPFLRSKLRRARRFCFEKARVVSRHD